MSRLIACITVLFTLFVIGCGGDDAVTPPMPVGSCDSTATHWFQLMCDTMATLGDPTIDEVRDFDFSPLRNGFAAVRAQCPDNAIANLGLSLLEILELNYSDDIWEVIDDLDAWSGGMGAAGPGGAGGRRGSILDRQLSLLVEVPFAVSLKRATDFPPDVTVERIQQIIENTVIPALSDALTLLGRVENETDMKLTLTVRDKGIDETIVIDLGEIYLFDASLRALRAAFRMAVSYDMDFVGADGTYDWIDEISHIQSIDCATYGIATATGGDTLSVYWTYNYEQAISESILVAVAYHNLENREDFLALRDGGNVLKLAQQDLLGMIGKLEASVDFIKNVRTGETEQNVVKLADLTGLESNLGDPEGPNFARDFETIDDALTWIHGFMSGPVEFTENLGPYGTPFTWTMDMSAMFDDPVEDWNDLLPYHRWNLPTGPWVAEELSDAWEYENYGNYPLDYYVYIEGACQSHTFYDIGYVKEYWYFYYSNITNPIELLDGPNGDVIDLEVEKVPYFPDYTLNGLFPGMSRSRWLELVDILGE